jgi:hypothetical protein
MVEYVTREEFEARVGVLEQDVDGEKLVTRYILEQTRRNGDDIAAIKTQLGRIETRLDGVDTQLESVGKRMGSLGTAVQDLKEEIPAIVAKVMREVLGDRKI